MTLEARAATIEAARTLAVPTVRTILRKRRNAIRGQKAVLLAELNADLERAVSAALALGLKPSVLISTAHLAPDDSRVLSAVVIRETVRLHRRQS